MKTLAQRLQLHLLLPISLSISIILTAGTPLALAAGQTATPSPTIRISAEVSSSQIAQLPNSNHPLSLAKYDSGRLPAGTKLQGISIYFSRTESQEADLKTLMAAQQNPASPQYHQWLTPDQFAARFGMADADIAKVESWLEQRGFSVDFVGRSKNMIRFSGTAGQAESAFATELHTYKVKTATGTENHFAPSTALSVPTALAGVVESVHNLDDFRPRSQLVKRMLLGKPKPAFSGSDGSIFFAPGDIAVQYDISKSYNAGYTGTGQSIALVGQSQVALSDIEAFQTAAGLPVKDPNLIYVPGTGTPVVSPGDETESDLDLEWSGAIAKGAAITLVYTGNASNAGAFDALAFAIDNRIANIVSSSYGDCETDLAGFSLESEFEQAATQGQTIMAAAGDDGSTDCFGDTDLTTTQQEDLAVDYPGSSPNVTSVGGTEISQANAAYETQGSAYWTASNGSADVITSLLQPVPEQAWNEDAAFCLPAYQQDGEISSPLCAGGGGASALFPKPSYQNQTGVPGIPNDGKRDVPDIALDAAIYNPGYLYCSSDSSEYQQGQESSCTSGFRDSATGDLTAAGGTSFAAPIFAGMVAIINQQQSYTTGQGPVNPTLYTLASTTYATAFHDITTGNNECDATGFCNSNGESGFVAGTGYDQATGLGTIDLTNLANAWPANTGVGASLIGTTTAISASNTAPTVNTSDNFTITVSPATGTVAPTGTVSITVDPGTPPTGTPTATGTLTANGTFVYTASFSTAGPHTIEAVYSGDTNYASSTGTITVNVGGVNTGVGSFTFTVGNITVVQGNEGTSTVTITPAGGYLGTVDFSLAVPTNSTLTNGCYEIANPVVASATPPTTTTLTFQTNGAACAAAGAAFRKFGQTNVRAAGIASPFSKGPIAAGVVFAGLLLAGFLGRYSRKLRVLAGVILLTTIGFAFTGCGSNGNSNTTVPNAPVGTFTLTLTGTDSSTPSITSSQTFTLTIQKPS